MCPGGSTFGLSLPLSFRFTGPLGLSSAFGASWSCVLEGGGGLALGGDLAEDTLALRNPRAFKVAAATLRGPNCRRTVGDLHGGYGGEFGVRMAGVAYWEPYISKSNEMASSAVGLGSLQE